MKNSIKLAIVAALAASLSAPAMALGEREKSALMGFAGALVLGHVLGGNRAPQQQAHPMPQYYPMQQAPQPQIEVYNNIPAPQPQYAPQPVYMPAPQPQYQQQYPQQPYGQPQEFQRNQAPEPPQNWQPRGEPQEAPQQRSDKPIDRNGVAPEDVDIQKMFYFGNKKK